MSACKRLREEDDESHEDICVIASGALVVSYPTPATTPGTTNVCDGRLQPSVDPNVSAVDPANEAGKAVPTSRTSPQAFAAKSPPARVGPMVVTNCLNALAKIVPLFNLLWAAAAATAAHAGTWTSSCRCVAHWLGVILGVAEDGHASGRPGSGRAQCTLFHRG